MPNKGENKMNRDNNCGEGTSNEGATTAKQVSGAGKKSFGGGKRCSGFKKRGCGAGKISSKIRKCPKETATLESKGDGVQV